MTVYVDHARNKFGNMVMSHMVADTIDELHEMASLIGVKRKWFQLASSFPHYDVSESKRQMALQNGAVSVSSMELIQIIQSLRKGQRDD